MGDVPLVCSEVVACGWCGDYDDAEPGDDCPDCATGIVSTSEECPPECPECGEVADVESDGSAHECGSCGWTWGTPSGRGASNPGRSLEPESGADYPTSPDVENASVSVTADTGGELAARVRFTIECPECDDGTTLRFDTIQKSVQCQGGCGTHWEVTV